MVSTTSWPRTDMRGWGWEIGCGWDLVMYEEQVFQHNMVWVLIMILPTLAFYSSSCDLKLRRGSHTSWKQDRDTKKFFENRNLKNLKTLGCRFCGADGAPKYLPFSTFQFLAWLSAVEFRTRKRTVDYLGGLWGGDAYRGPDLFLAHTGGLRFPIRMFCKQISS